MKIEAIPRIISSNSSISARIKEKNTETDRLRLSETVQRHLVSVGLANKISRNRTTSHCHFIVIITIITDTKWLLCRFVVTDNRQTQVTLLLMWPCRSHTFNRFLLYHHLRHSFNWWITSNEFLKILNKLNEASSIMVSICVWFVDVSFKQSHD